MDNGALRMYREGYRDALRRGLSPEDADRDARERVRRHQYDRAAYLLRQADSRLDDAWREDT